MFQRIYQHAGEHWEAYETCEELVDLEEAFMWGASATSRPASAPSASKGTGGSSGVGFLRAVLDLTLFPELYAVRTEIGSS